MSAATEQTRISEHAAKAERALSRGEVFEAERAALKALLLARQTHDFEGMVTVIPTLMESRLQRLKQALDVGRITIIDEPVSEDVKVSKGCYLVRPPQVGADARRLRVAALEQEAPIAVICHEPLTAIRLLPIVAISPGLTLRTKIKPPSGATMLVAAAARTAHDSKPKSHKPLAGSHADISHLTADDFPVTWFASAIEALGDFAIESLDPKMAALRRVDALLERLDALPEHEGLHRALQQASRDAAITEAEESATRARRSAAAAGRKPGAKPLTEGDDIELTEEDDNQDQ